jgi:hypothetical protein
MARNGSGTYNRAVSPYTAGTTITAATVNSEMDDIATALTGSMARDGQSPATANIPMGGFRLTGLGNAIATTDAAALGQLIDGGRPWVDLASATTTDLGAQNANNIRITGTTTITGFGTAASGVTRELRFAGALTLTHNATSLILPGAANITTAAGDTATAISLGSGNWIVTAYQYATTAAARSAIGVPASPSLLGFQHIATVTGGTWTLPAGGTWAYSVRGFIAASGASNFQFVSGVAAGGTAIISSGGVVFEGFAWRIA